MNEQEMYQYLYDKYGDIVDTWDNAKIQSEYNKIVGNVSDDAIQNQDLNEDRRHNQNMRNIGLKMPGTDGKRAMPWNPRGRDFNEMQEASEKATTEDNGQDTTPLARKPLAKEARMDLQPGQGITSEPSSVPAPSTHSSGTTTTTNVTTNAQNGGKYQPMSILQAYYAGCFGETGSDSAKQTRNYLLADAFGGFARNLGRSIGNVGAQYTGGTIDNNVDESQWSKRNEEIMKQGISADAATVDNSDKNIERKIQKEQIRGAELANRLNEMKLTIPEEYKKLIESADNIDNPLLKTAIKGGAATLLDKSVNGGEITPAAFIAAVSAYGGNELAEYAKSQGKSVEQLIGDIAKSFGDTVKKSMF